MLYAFRLSNELLNSPSLKINAMNKSFLESWRKNGVITFKEPSSIISFKREISEKVDPKFHQIWNIALTSNLIVFNENLDEIDFLLNNEDFDEILSKKFGCSTIYVDQDTEDLISCYSNYKRYCSNELKEVVSIDSYHDSLFLTESELFSNKQIDADETLDFIWEKRLKNFFKFNDTITIVDRYLYVNEWDSYNRGGNSALLNLFRRLANDNIKLKKIEFVSNDFVDEVDISSLFEKYIWSSSFLKDVCGVVKLVAKEDSFFKGDFHDRLVRSNRHYIEIGLGLGDILRENKMKKFTTLTMKPKKPVDYDNYINSAVSIDLSKSQEWIKKYIKENPL
ncbi:hypothetical protein [Acinetobacter venetianus]|uniref:hypothetical protein n=1 Tax=Acinetobacter venetianus TaxID=52133 RepID=UPI0007781A4B|nr:hypothetical protein [Acinetobacter venetianus]KXZ64235.1 hypothetical protein AVENLUH7437_02168 [Acinetobacter venetianus]